MEYTRYLLATDPLELINHHLISNGTQYYAEAVVGDESVVVVKSYTFSEVYDKQKILDALSECGSTSEVEDVVIRLRNGYVPRV